MAQPVVHFEIHGKDGKKLQAFYASLFDWNVDANNPMSYGMVAAGEGGIGGGVTESPAAPLVTVYVNVPDLASALQKAESLGGKTVMPRADLGMVIMALYEDPEGNLMGLVEA